MLRGRVDKGEAIRRGHGPLWPGLRGAVRGWRRGARQGRASAQDQARGRNAESAQPRRPL